MLLDRRIKSARNLPRTEFILSIIHSNFIIFLLLNEERELVYNLRAEEDQSSGLVKNGTIKEAPLSYMPFQDHPSAHPLVGKKAI